MQYGGIRTTRNVKIMVNGCIWDGVTIQVFGMGVGLYLDQNIKLYRDIRIFLVN
jgi:hypothetical protein